MCRKSINYEWWWWWWSAITSLYFTTKTTVHRRLLLLLLLLIHTTLTLEKKVAVVKGRERMAPAEDIVCVFSGTFSHFRCVLTDHTHFEAGRFCSRSCCRCCWASSSGGHCVCVCLALFFLEPTATERTRLLFFCRYFDRQTHNAMHGGVNGVSMLHSQSLSCSVQF